MASASQWPVIGHEWAIDLLQNSLAADRLAHALLFSGPAQVGKTTLALALALALNCQEAERPCGQCLACTKIARHIHPDVRVLRPEMDKGGRAGTLKIDQVRELQREASLAPLEGRRKVFILRELERASLPAANALLKTLEEPPPKVVLLLTSARPHALLPTVASRCQALHLRPMPWAQVAAALSQRWQAEPERAALLARLSGGRLGWAVQRLTDDKAWEERRQRLADIRALSHQGRVARLAYAADLSQSPSAVLPALLLWSTWWRDLLLMQHGCRGSAVNIDLATELAEEALLFDSGQVRGFLARLQAAPTQLRQNVNTRLLLESLMLHLPRPVRQAI